MDPARYARAESIFHEAADLPRADRTAYVARECGDDVELRDAVMGMLDADADAGGRLLDRDLGSVARQMIAGSAPPQDQFGPYRMARLLGEGGMGVVYLGVRDDLGSHAAIKILRDAWVSPARRDRFAAEQRTLAHLNHPNIARLYDAGALADGTPWFVMEYVDGLPITAYCREHALNTDAMLRLFRDVCAAVQYAHRQLIVHRDLKPSNILVDAGGAAKLLDFGIAKELESLDTPAHATETGLRLMTPAYASPQRLRGAATGVDADVYSLGVVLYELLSGRLPFDPANLTPAELEAAILDSPPPALASVPEDLQVLCLTAMHKDPSRRYGTVEALLRDLDHYLRAEPLEARPDTLGYRLGKFLRRRTREVAAVAIVFSFIVGLVTFYTVSLTRARNEAVANATRAQRIQQFILNLFEGGDPEAGPSDKLNVATLVDRGVQEARSLSAEPAVQSDFYETLGGIYQKLGNLDQSDALLTQALAKRREVHGTSSAEVAEVLISQGLLRADQAKFDEAEKLVREGLAMTRARLPETHISVSRAMVALGKVESGRGRYDEAIATLGEAVRLQNGAGADPRERAGGLYELASAQFYAGKYDESEALSQQALTLYLQVYGGRHPLVSDCLINLGAIQFERGKYPEAEKFYRQGLEITQAWYGRDHYKTAANLAMLARTLNRTPERQAEARDLLGQSLAIRERVYGPNHPNVASAVNELGTVALIANRLDDAERYYSRVVDIYRQVYGTKHYLLGLGLANLASAHSAGKKFGRAEELFREALAVYAGTLAPDHTNVGIARIKLGRALLRQSRYADASVETLAGYDVLKKQMEPGVSWLVNARRDLIEAYDALKRPAEADRFRKELASLEKK